MKFTEIQQLLCLMQGLDWEQRTKDHEGKTVRAWRGYGCTFIQEIAEEYLTKGEDGKYRLRGKDAEMTTIEEIRASASFMERYERLRRETVAEGGVATPPLSSEKATLKLMDFRRRGKPVLEVTGPGGQRTQLDIEPHEVYEGRAALASAN